MQYYHIFFQHRETKKSKRVIVQAKNRLESVQKAEEYFGFTDEYCPWNILCTPLKSIEPTEYCKAIGIFFSGRKTDILNLVKKEK